MPRPNFIKVSYYPISDQGRRGPKTFAEIPLSYEYTPIEIARLALESPPKKVHIIEAKPFYRKVLALPPAMSGQEFREWRERMGYSTAEASDALAVTLRTIQYYERGDRPVSGTVAKLCKFLEAA